MVKLFFQSATVSAGAAEEQRPAGGLEPSACIGKQAGGLQCNQWPVGEPGAATWQTLAFRHQICCLLHLY